MTFSVVEVNIYIYVHCGEPFWAFLGLAIDWTSVYNQIHEGKGRIGKPKIKISASADQVLGPNRKSVWHTGCLFSHRLHWFGLCNLPGESCQPHRRESLD